VSIVDARGGAEALGLKKATSTGRTDCQSYTGTGFNTRCSPPFEGRLKGAHSVPWPQFLDTSQNGFQFLPKAAVKAIFDTQAEYQPGQLTIQYCRTNMRSMVTGIVASVILGYPTRFYDTSFIEWSHMAYGPTPLTRVLPENSPFRTDLVGLTEHADVTGYTPGGGVEGITINGWVDGPNYNDDVDISPTPPDISPDSNTASLSVEADRAYKLE
jgi:thiosulfate/3-mercaptopyruvate sulfurtransferase